jgi:hypothetical protein
MSRTAFEGFSAVVPEGWKASREEATYSEGAEHAPIRFRTPDRQGTLRVHVPWVDADEQPGADPDELEAMAREWGIRRGVGDPLVCTAELASGLAQAFASYRIGEDLVEVWYLSDGATLIQASYVCRWEARDVERAARMALVGSLRPPG